VTHTCWVDVDTVTPRVQWFEYVYTPGGGIISDGDFITPAHPHADRYTLIRTNPWQYDLHIRDVRLSDGGTYTCQDINAVMKRRHSAELVVVEGPQNCTTTVPTPPTAAVEETYYTHVCETHYQGRIAPFMQWTGPDPFTQFQTTTPTTVWSGMAFYSSRTMNNQFWQSRLNFTNNFLPVPGDTADNIPTLEQTHTTDRITVNWAPQAMYADPVKPLNEYEVGDSITCFADAFPTASYQWQNLDTGDVFPTSIFVIPQSWLGGEYVMRCLATNTINGLPRSSQLFLQVNVPFPTTPTTPTTTTTTTPPPPVSACHDLTGRWMSTGPTHAVMCMEVDSSSGSVTGVLRNATDVFWLDVVGSTDLPSHHHASFTAIWPQNRAVTAFIGECSRCNGVEVLLLNAISRSKGGPPCGTPGQIQYTEQYEFIRHNVPWCPPISFPT
jgi:hypothetical protein